LKKPDPRLSLGPRSRNRDVDETDPFGFELPEDGWMMQFRQLCAADDLDENGVVRWKAWLESRPPGLVNGPPSADAE
jgi:hypothetical protein